jgi:hypothetical protein
MRTWVTVSVVEEKELRAVRECLEAGLAMLLLCPQVAGVADEIRLDHLGLSAPARNRSARARGGAPVIHGRLDSCLVRHIESHRA